MNDGLTYVTLESALAALEKLDMHNGHGQLEDAKAMLVKRIFQTVGRAQELKGTAGAFTQAVFDGKQVKENDWLYGEVKHG